jgi:hypothetical protein
MQLLSRGSVVPFVIIREARDPSQLIKYDFAAAKQFKITSFAIHIYVAVFAAME